MPKTRELSDFEKGKIIGLHEYGVSPTEISEVLKFPRQTIQSIIKKYKERNGDVSNAPRSGRPPILMSKLIV